MRSDWHCYWRGAMDMGIVERAKMKKLLILLSVALNVLVLLYAVGLIRVILEIQKMMKENQYR
jgi:hypothetical protein